MRLRRFGRGRVDSPREAAAAARLDREAREGTLAGKPLVLHARPFYLDTTAYLRAAAGPPAWSTRLARIQRLRADLKERVHSAWNEHVAGAAPQAPEAGMAWSCFVESLDLGPINDLIEKHNAYYPLEAGLRMEWPSGRYLVPRGMEYPMSPVTRESLLSLDPRDRP